MANIIDTNRPDQNGSQAEESEQEIILIGKRLHVQIPSNGGSGVGAALSVIAHSGGTNGPDIGLSELLRDLFNVQTDYDLDTHFTAKQREIIFKALQGLADHPLYGPAMAALAQKNADINIIADFDQRHTGPDHGITVGKNADGTIDNGESITIYINMNYGGSPTSDFGFATTVLHELIHTFGDPTLDSALDMPGSRVDLDAMNDIFNGYDFWAPPSQISLEANIVDTPDFSGMLTGSANYEIFSGSSAADMIAPDAGGSLIYSGGGDDRFLLTLDGDIDEIIDSAGSDTIEFPSGTPLSAISVKWSSDGRNLAVSVDGHVEAVMVDAAGNGMIEQISIGSASYAVASFSPAINTAPNGVSVNATVFGSFFGGWVANAAGSDADGDTLEYRIASISGEYADQVWTIDKDSGNISTNLTRFAQPGSQYTYLAIIASDGIDTTNSNVMVRWGNSNEPDMPIEYSVEPQFEQPMLASLMHIHLGGLQHADYEIF